MSNYTVKIDDKIEVAFFFNYDRALKYCENLAVELKGPTTQLYNGEKIMREFFVTDKEKRTTIYYKEIVSIEMEKGLKCY